ncbi:MAG: hypothetical protein HOE90_18050 [Bacteriovoracaceae bacterium]|nr:hypothetical protein [Bacteriovoracaceae bacterium]
MNHYCLLVETKRGLLKLRTILKLKTILILANFLNAFISIYHYSNPRIEIFMGDIVNDIDLK